MIVKCFKIKPSKLDCMEAFLFCNRGRIHFCRFISSFVHSTTSFYIKSSIKLKIRWTTKVICGYNGLILGLIFWSHFML